MAKMRRIGHVEGKGQVGSSSGVDVARLSGVDLYAYPPPEVVCLLVD